MELPNLLIQPEEDTSCKHPNIPIPEFDAEKARMMSSRDVRLLYPRLVNTCPDCNQSVITYASFEHYIAGDW